MGRRALYYRAKQGFDDRSVNIAVVVQQMINSEKAGVMFTSHPVTGEPLSIIEGSWGLGESVVSGSVSPDKYVFDQRTGKVIDRLVARKKIEIVSDGEHGTKTLDVGKERQETPVLSDDEIARLATFGKVAETHYGVPQDVEWSIVGTTIYILQSRPITTIRTSNAAVKDRFGRRKDPREGAGGIAGRRNRACRGDPECQGYGFGQRRGYSRHEDDKP